MKNNENGRSMVEMLGVLAIIGVLSAGGLAGYSKAMFKHKLNSTMDQITMLVTNIRTMYGTQGNYAGLDEGTAYDLGIVPSVMVASDGRKDKDGKAVQGGKLALTNPFKGDVEIETFSATNGTDTTTGFKLTYKDVTPEACVALSTADFGSGAGSGFIGVAVGDAKTATYIGEEGQTEGSALTMDEAITACNTTDDITWYFY